MVKKVKKKAPRKPTVKGGKAKIKMGRHFARIARSPLKKQKSSDAWNERQNRLVASRDAVKLIIRGTIEKNRAKKRKAKKRKPRGSRTTK